MKNDTPVPVDAGVGVDFCDTVGKKDVPAGTFVGQRERCNTMDAAARGAAFSGESTKPGGATIEQEGAPPEFSREI